MMVGREGSVGMPAGSARYLPIFTAQKNGMPLGGRDCGEPNSMPKCSSLLIFSIFIIEQNAPLGKTGNPRNGCSKCPPVDVAECSMGQPIPTSPTGYTGEPGLLVIERGEPFAYGVLDQGGGVVDVEFGHDPLPGGLDGLDADLQVQGNLFGGFSLGDELQDLSLSGGQDGRGIFLGFRQGAPDIVFRHDVSDLGAEVGSVIQGGLQGVNQVMGDVRFQYVARDAGFEHVDYELAFAVHG